MHKPVLLAEMLEILSPVDGGIYIDATFGAGGYTKGILDSAQCTVYCIDRDTVSEEFFSKLSQESGERLHFLLGKFSDLPSIIRHFNLEKVDGVVFDVGVSSMQLADSSRGFSFMNDGPLNMRMDGSLHGRTAEVFVNSMPEKEMADIIYHYGGERYSRRVASAIVNHRRKGKIVSTSELASIIRSVVPRSKANPIDPATRTFQAIRIWTNDELEELQLGLDSAVNIVKAGGKVIVTTFHSLEDRIVKYKFNSLAGIGGYKLVNKKVIRPTDQEIADNPRARSAKLRAILKE